MTDPTDDAPLQRRGTLGLLVLAMPIVSVLITGTLYFVLIRMGYAGRPPTGPLVTVDITTCPEAVPLIEARAEAMGLSDRRSVPREGGVTLTVRLPDDPRTHQQIPETLASVGHLVIRPMVGEEDDAQVIVDESEIEFATAYMAFLDAPKVLVQLQPDASRRLHHHMQDHPGDRVGYWLDGRRVTVRKNMPPETRGQVTLDLINADNFQRTDFAAHAAMVLEHGPLPCEAVLQSVTVLEEPG